ncbi:MAG: sugar-binding protein [Vicinamibacterales bacterium]
MRLVVLSLVLGGIAEAQTANEFHVTRTAQPPKIDGVLDDEVWKQAPLPLSEWVSYQRVRGDKMSAELRTEVRIAYDDRNIYFAFHCFDNEPGRIRTTVSRRDSSFSDDWIAISLDSAGTGQSAYHLFSNPSGSQMDALNTSASGEQFDADFVPRRARRRQRQARHHLRHHARRHRQS